MSKRALTRKRGWIEFEGLQFALPFMTRSQLVETIHAFFEERGLSLAVRNEPLKIRFSREKNPRLKEDGQWMLIAGVHKSVWTGHNRLKTDVIVVYTRINSTRDQFVNTLFHELDHAAWVLEGRTFDHSIEYWQRPHEVRARSVGAEWKKRLER